MLKPVPEIAAEFTVRAVVPEDVSVTVPTFAEFTATLPKLRLVALSFSCGFAAVALAEKTTSTKKFVDAYVDVVGKPLFAEWR